MEAEGMYPALEGWSGASLYDNKAGRSYVGEGNVVDVAREKDGSDYRFENVCVSWTA